MCCWFMLILVLATIQLKILSFTGPTKPTNLIHSCYTPARPLLIYIMQTVKWHVIASLSLASMFIALSKQTYILVTQQLNPNHYPMLSMEASTDQLDSLAKEVVIENPSLLQICARDTYSPSLYLYNTLYPYIKRISMKVEFPKSSACLSSVPSGAYRLLYGGSQPPLLIKPH